MLKPELASLSHVGDQLKLPFLCSISLWHWPLLWPNIQCLPLAIIFNQLVLTKFLYHPLWHGLLVAGTVLHTMVSQRWHPFLLF